MKQRLGERVAQVIVLTVISLAVEHAWSATEVVRYWYDDSGRLVTAGYVSSVTNTSAVRYDYDANGNRTNLTVLGRGDSADRDSDAMPDVDELAYFGDFSQTGNGDFDGDGLANNAELPFGAVPVLYDSDSDGANDYHEWAAGTDPGNPSSLFNVVAAEADTGHVFTVHFYSVADRTYTLQRTDDLFFTPWTNVPGQGPRPGVNGPDSMTDTNEYPRMFFRIQVRR